MYAIRSYYETYSRSEKKLVGWSTVDEQADLLLKMDIGLASTHIEFEWHGAAHALDVPFSDYASLENIGHCLAFILESGYESDAIFRSFRKLQAVAMRLELKQGINNCLLINDYYNSDINSLTIALQFLRNNFV